jgi:excisionase family DNA binding protein
MGLVVALNANDISTTASCEGHIDWGAPYPWVDIGCCNDPRIVSREQEIAILLSEGKKGSQELERLHTELKQIHYQEELKLISVLEAFYRVRPLDYDRHLTLVHITRGGCRMRSQGADIQELRAPEEQALKLKEYQDEMQAFASFLKARFFGESVLPRKEEYTTAEAASELGVEHQTVVRNILRHNLVAEKRGRDYFIKAAEFERFKNTPRRSGRPAKV